MTPFVGGSKNSPIYKDSKLTIAFEDEGVADSSKTGLKKGARIAKTQAMKAVRKAQENTIGLSTRLPNNYLLSDLQFYHSIRSRMI